MRFVATLDARLLQDGVPPPLVAGHPALRIRPVAQEAGEAAAAGQKAADNTKQVRQAYEATLMSDAPLGPLTGSVTFMPVNETAANRVKALQSASLLLAGQVVGPVQAEPALLAFGTVALGQASTRQVVLSARDGAPLDRLKVACASAQVKARVVQSGADAALVEVTLTPLSGGAFSSQLKVTLASGLRLLVPVSAFVK